MHEPSIDYNTSAAKDMQYSPGRIEDERLRHPTGGSDDSYVKVQAEPIYDFPPKSTPKQMSPEEARALQARPSSSPSSADGFIVDCVVSELYQEYDFGVDILPPGQGQQLPPQHPAGMSPRSRQAQTSGSPNLQPHGINFVAPTTAVQFTSLGEPAPGTGQEPPFQNQQQQQLQVRFDQTTAQGQQSPYGAVGDRPSDKSPLQIQQQQHPMQQQINLNISKLPPSERKNLANAEMFIQDALEYLGNQQQNKRASGTSGQTFVMEEEMLSSQGNSSKRPLQPQQQRLMSGGADPTTQMVKTTDAFDRIEHDEHDDMTYAPEIQSVEIPPDQLSEGSDNLQEYFDKVAAEGVDLVREDTLKKAAVRKDIGTPDSELASSSDRPDRLKPVGRAPQMFHPSGKRVASNSSITSMRSGRNHSEMSSDGYPKLRKQSSLLSILGVTSMQEVLLQITSLEALSEAMRKAGLESTNLIFGIDYTASNKYQGEESFHGRSLHTIHPNIKNPYQQVISILGRTLAPFATTGRIPVFGFGDAKTGDWSTFNLSPEGDCRTLDEVLKLYNQITPRVELSGPTNFAPLIYQAIETCQRTADYHILVIIADGQVTNERATRRAIVQACQYPLSIIVVGVGDGPWDMMRVRGFSYCTFSKYFLSYSNTCIKEVNNP
ncbi:hypothetical protein WR25_23489 isoform E [Diploscapter pachys]|uniref:VWFA domain-containing protein n=1 Tax=Diploscapter pachys TaxID=2018661 RepID=A0A2A2L9G2_9BILA|nr:hypothetical protein WR25_23489 isoform A [Diploscapter pachys]PAV82687.1 hypothetical protein WR25_23489 isoform E [Diploscapter pachys]